MAYIDKQETSLCALESSDCGMVETSKNVMLYLFQPISARAIDSCHLQFLQHSMSQPNPTGAKDKASVHLACQNRELALPPPNQVAR